MNISNVKAGDIVKVDKRGQFFLAEVTDIGKGEILIQPEIKHVTYRTAKAREVVAHYRKSKQSTR